MNISELKKLIRLFENSEIDELEVESEGTRVKLGKGCGQPVTVMSAQQVPALQNTQAVVSPATSPAVESSEASGNLIVKSPMVGTFYSTSAPGSPPFVSAGDTARKGQTLCIIEAMKLMNEIESEVNGKIIKVFPENGKPVEFDEPLFEIEVA